MKFLVPILSVFFSASVFATSDELTVEMHVTDVKLSDAVELIHSKCKGWISPLVVEHPEALISINFDQIECRALVVIVKDFDSNPAET